MATYLVTGGAGFIGSHLVRALLARGDAVHVLDNFSTGCRENLPAHAGLTLIEGDIRDAGAVNAAVRGVDYVLHQAALPSVPRSIADPVTTHEVNATGTLNVLLAARAAGVKRLVYASSSSAYGDSTALPKIETMPTNPLSPYAVSKLAGENYCRAFHRVYGLPVVMLRYFNVFGPRQTAQSQYAAVIPRFIAALRCGQQAVIHGDGRQSRDFTYIANVVQANLLACESERADGQVLNIAGGEQHTVLELYDELAGLLHVTGRPAFEPQRAGDVKHSLASIERAAELLGYQVRIGWRDGLHKTVDWWLSQDEIGTRGPERPQQ